MDTIDPLLLHACCNLLSVLDPVMFGVTGVMTNREIERIIVGLVLVEVVDVPEVFPAPEFQYRLTTE
jgi:hypothetical protein